MKNLLCAVSAAALLCIASALEPGRDYALMIDAGSTGSRIRLFSWAERVFTTLPPPLSVPIQQEDFLYKVTPGIGTDAGRAELAKLVAAAKADPQLKDDESRWNEIPVYLFATAGMRILSMDAREQAFSEVRTILGDSGFKFAAQQARGKSLLQVSSCCPPQIIYTVISGEEEGVFGWLTANSLLGKLPSASPSAYVGALDMGGASTQITFVPTTSLLSNLFHVSLETDVQQDVYTHSFLYLGLDKSRSRANQLVMLNTTATGGARDHPCMLRNGTTPYLLTVNDVGDNVPFRGAGDWDACVAYYAYLMNTRTVCTTDAQNPGTLEPASSIPTARTGLPVGGRLPVIQAGGNNTCSVDGVYQPPLAGTPLVAFSGYTYLYEFFNLAANASPSQLAAAGRAFCSLSLQQAVAAHPGPVSFTLDYCATAAYIHTLWTVGFGIDEDSHQITVAVGSNSSAYSYAYGSMLYEANSLTWQYAASGRKGTNSEDTWQILAFAFMGLFVVSLLVAIWALVRVNRSGKSGGITSHNAAYSSSLNGSTILGDAYSNP